MFVYSLLLQSPSHLAYLQQYQDAVLWVRIRMGPHSFFVYIFHVKLFVTVWPVPGTVWPGLGSGSAWIRIGLAPWIRIRIEIKDQIRIHIENNADPRHCLKSLKCIFFACMENTFLRNVGVFNRNLIRHFQSLSKNLTQLFSNMLNRLILEVCRISSQDLNNLIFALLEKYGSSPQTSYLLMRSQ